MKLFTATQAREAVSQIFKDHGLNSQTPAKPSDIHILPVTRPSLQYILNASSIHAHLKGEIEDTYATSEIFDYCLNKVPVAVTFECPPLRFVFDSLTAGEKDTLLQLGLSADTANVYTGQLPTSAISEIAKMKPQSDTYRAGTVDWDGYVAWVLMMRFLTFFSYASQYFENPVTIIADDADVTTAATANEIIVSKVGTSAEGSYNVAADEYAVRFESGKLMVRGGGGLKSFSFTNLDSFRKSSLFAFSIVMPFFEQLLLPDGQFTFSTFMSLFGQTLGFSKSAPSLIARLRRGISSMAFSSAGRAISHAILVSQLAVQSGRSVIFIVHKGAYKGAVLTSNTPFFVMFGGAEYKAEGPDRTMIDIESMDAHTKSINDIAKELTGKIYRDAVITVSVEDIKTSRNLYGVLQTYLPFILANYSTQQVIEQAIENLRFQDRYEEPSQGAIIAFLDYVTTGHAALLSDKPAFLKEGRWMKTDRVDVGLSVFGPTAPTLNWGADKKPSEVKTFSLSGIKAIDIFSEKADHVAMYLPYKVIAVNGAASQWKLLFSSGNLTLVPGRKGKKEQFNLTGTKANITGTFAIEIWNKMHQLHLLAKESKKRKGDNQITGAKAKKPRDAEEDDADML